MLQQLRQYYYWPGMRRDVYTWTSQCAQCQKVNLLHLEHMDTCKKL